MGMHKVDIKEMRVYYEKITKAKLGYSAQESALRLKKLSAIGIESKDLEKALKIGQKGTIKI